MRQNIGLVDAYLRLFTGCLLLGMGAGTKRSSRFGSFLLLTLGANKVAEGITRWCPIMSALNIDTLSAAERTALAAERLGPRYGRLSHNPYRTYSEDELEDTNGTPEQVQEQPPGDDDPRKVRNGFSRPGTSRREPLATVGQPEGE